MNLSIYFYSLVIYFLLNYNLGVSNKEHNTSCYILNKEGKGGLGELYVDVLSDGTIQVRSYPINLSPLRGFYGATITDVRGEYRVVKERSFLKENDNFDNPHTARPYIEEIERIIYFGNTLTENKMKRKDFVTLIENIKNAYNKPTVSDFFRRKRG